MPVLPRTEVHRPLPAPVRVRGEAARHAWARTAAAGRAAIAGVGDLLARRHPPWLLPGKLTGALRLLLVIVAAEAGWLWTLIHEKTFCFSGRVCQVATLDGRQEQVLPVAMAAVCVLLPVALWTRGFARARPFSLLLIAGGALTGVAAAAGVLAVLAVGAVIAAGGVAVLAGLLLTATGGT
jgi:hypothetical protein